MAAEASRGWRAKATRHLRQAWLTRGVLARGLWPVSQVYRLLLWWHRRPYRQGRRLPHRLSVPVVVVGNVLVGGTGKTPTVMALVEHLRARGWRPGVVSRGHGREGAPCEQVLPDSDGAAVGDEPLLIVQRTGVPLVVGRDRPAAGRHLLERHPEVNVIVSDDGMQHWALHRDLTLVLFDQRGCGNGWLLPAGPLREPWPARPLRDEPLVTVQTHLTRRLADTAHNREGQARPLSDWAASRPGNPPAALAAIAQPERFFDMLQARGVALSRCVALPDHADTSALLSSIRRHPADLDWLCTEKDAVKLFPALTAAEASRIWAVPLEQPLPDDVAAAVDTRLEALSSRHGYQTP